MIAGDDLGYFTIHFTAIIRTKMNELMRHHFGYEFDDDPKHGDFDVDLNAPPEARIRFDVTDGDVWVSANRAGCLHLAKICAEMSMHTQFKAGYHFHRTFDWKSSDGTTDEVAFELSSDD